MSEKMNVTYGELEKLVRRRTKLKRIFYGFYIRPFMPTGEGRGFEGCSIVKCSRKDFLNISRDLLNVFEERGAKIALIVPTEDYESFLI